jgi:hypothetical protein
MDELDVHIQNLNDEIDSHMGPEEKQAVEAVKEVTGTADASARAIIRESRYKSQPPPA